MARRLHAQRLTQVSDMSASERVCNAFSHFNRFAPLARSNVCYFCLSISSTLFVVFWHFGMLSSRGGESAVGAHVLMISYVQHALMMRVTDSTMAELPLLILIHFI